MRYTYGAENARVVIKYDRDNDGDIDSYHIQILDERGNETMRSLDFDADGHPDEIWTRTWDTAGNWLRLEIDRYADGVVDQCEIREYDQHNNVVREAIDVRCDQIVESCSTLQYEYDSDGRILEKRIDVDDDGKLDQIVAWNYDDSNARISQKLDLNLYCLGLLSTRFTELAVVDTMQPTSTWAAPSEVPW